MTDQPHHQGPSPGQEVAQTGPSRVYVKAHDITDVCRLIPDALADPVAEVLTGDRVVILAGGEGTRLSDSGDAILASVPKLLLEIFPDGPGSRPVQMIDYVLRELSANGFANVAVVTAPSNKYGDAVAEHVMSQPVGSILPTLIREHARRGTGWAVRVALSLIYSPDLIVLPGDIVFPFYMLEQALSEHCSAPQALTWLVTTQATPTAQNFGRIIIDENQRQVVGSLEGHTVPCAAHVHAGTALATSAGAIILSRDPVTELIDEYIAAHGRPQHFELYSEFLPWLIEAGVPVSYFDVEHEVHDLGAPERIAQFRPQWEN